MKKLSLLYLIFSVIFHSCENRNSQIDQNSIDNQVNTGVIILKNTPENWKYVRKDSVYIHDGKYELSFTKDNFNFINYLPDKKIAIDTISIEDLNEPIELVHKYKGLDKFSFLMKPNDTIVFTYTKNLPMAEVINRNIKKHDLDYEKTKRQFFKKDGFISQVKWDWSGMTFVEDLSKLDFDEIKQIEHKHKAEALKELNIESKLLDSLKGNNLMSEDIFNFYNLKNKLLLDRINIIEEKGLNGKRTLQEDSLLKYSFYRNYLNDYAAHKFGEISLNNNTLQFDSILNTNVFSHQEKRYLLFNLIQDIVNTKPIAKSQEYLIKYRAFEGTNSKLVNNIIEKYSLNDQVSNSIKLKDFNGNKTSFQRVLNINKGKVVYVDFWASWCIPCRKAMPDSKLLRDEYTDKKVSFVYLAINDREDNWKKAVVKDGLSDFENSFLITNSKTSKLLESLKIHEIPRYLIYDQNGVLVHKNAPGPSSVQLRVFLNEILKTNSL